MERGREKSGVKEKEKGDKTGKKQQEKRKKCMMLESGRQEKKGEINKKVEGKEGKKRN